MAVQQNSHGRPVDTGRGWQAGLPVLKNSSVTLRELALKDAAALLAHVDKPPVLHYIAPPPSTVDGFRRFIRWTHKVRRRGTFVCYGIVLAGETEPVGIIQMWPLEPSFMTAEWGFVLDNAYWGTGVFLNAARLLLDFAFERFGIHRLEARSVVENGRGNGVLQKLGATREGTLRSCFQRDGVYMDHIMWSILADEWTDARARERTLL